MISLDKIAYTSKILKNNPNEKVFFSVATMLTALFLNDIYISAVVLLLMYIFIVYIGGISSKIFLKLMLLPATFLVISIIAILITRVQPDKIYILKFIVLKWELGIMYSSLKKVGQLFFKSLACISCLYFLILTTPVVDILYSLEKVKLPKILIEVIGLVYRYIFVFIEASQLIYISQDSRLGYSNMKRSFYSAGKLVSSLFLKALKQADESFISMEARCYNGEVNFIHSKYISSRKNFIIVIIMNIFFIILHFILK